MTNLSFGKMFLLATFFACCSMAKAQLPNEKFGKPSNLEWEFVGWGDAIDADAVVLCKTMKASYQISDQVFYNTQSSDFDLDNLQDFSKNQVDDSNILVRYEIRLRTKILKPDGAKHANIDITFYDADDNKVYDSDVLSDFKIKVFSKNDKGKVEKRNVATNSFVKERIDNNYSVLHVVVPDVEAGSIIEYQYDITSIRPTFLYDWVFQEDIPTVHSKCDIEIPAFLQFNMNAPINKLIKSTVEVGRLAYDSNRIDLKKGKSFPTNHYKIVGDYILPKGHALKHNQGDAADKGDAAEEIAVFTSKVNMANVTPPAGMPEGSTHLKIK